MKKKEEQRYLHTKEHRLMQPEERAFMRSVFWQEMLLAAFVVAMLLCFVLSG